MNVIRAIDPDPCVHCKSIDLHVQDAYSSYWVHCNKCGCNGPPDYSEHECIKKWNIRYDVRPTKMGHHL